MTQIWDRRRGNGAAQENNLRKGATRQPIMTDHKKTAPIKKPPKPGGFFSRRQQLKPWP